MGLGQEDDRTDFACQILDPSSAAETFRDCPVAVVVLSESVWTAHGSKCSVLLFLKQSLPDNPIVTVMQWD